jgi:hypothetical protein
MVRKLCFSDLCMVVLTSAVMVPQWCVECCTHTSPLRTPHYSPKLVISIHFDLSL